MSDIIHIDSNDLTDTNVIHVVTIVIGEEYNAEVREAGMNEKNLKMLVDNLATKYDEIEIEFHNDEENDDVGYWVMAK